MAYRKRVVSSLLDGVEMPGVSTNSAIGHRTKRRKRHCMPVLHFSFRISSWAVGHLVAICMLRATLDPIVMRTLPCKDVHGNSFLEVTAVRSLFMKTRSMCHRCQLHHYQ